MRALLPNDQDASCARKGPVLASRERITSHTPLTSDSAAGSVVGHGCIGKQVRRRLYVGVSQLPEIPDTTRGDVELAQSLAEARGCRSYNVIRIDDERREITLLDYPSLGDEPFPSLRASWRVHLPTSLVTFRSYDQSLNRPILHRTELLLPESHPAKPPLTALTQVCESLGLFENTSIIGFRNQWLQLIASKGYSLSGFVLVPLGNDIPKDISDAASDESQRIERYRTALSRSTISAPVQSLVRDGLLTPTTTFFDYGCGRGDDLVSLKASGISAQGWDPHYRPDEPRLAADVVNLGFVINVIEDKAERIAALEQAFELTRSVLAVAAMINGGDAVAGLRGYRDGVLTSRRTFQKYYTQGELQQFLESVLDHDAYPAAPGVYYVFKDRAVEQTYLIAKSCDRSRVARARLASVIAFRPARQRAVVVPNRSETPEAMAYLEALWTRCLQLGRVPTGEEWPAPVAAQSLFGSTKRALTACLAHHDPAAIAQSAQGRKDDLLVMLALQFFQRRRPFTKLESHLQSDIRAFFGSYALAEAQGQKLLFSVQDPQLIASACEAAASRGLGWLVTGESLQLHTSLVERLPAPLRVYIGCATALAGSITTYDLVKVHITSGKVTLMTYDDFVGRAVPSLKTRIKVRLRDQDLDVFEYAGQYDPSVLYCKSRYINEEFPHYAEQVAFDEALERLHLFDTNNHGVTAEEFHKTLSKHRYEVRGFELARSATLPALNAPCGAVFRYRDLIECSETWHRTHIDNTPHSADSYNALFDLATQILDPAIDYFGAIKLTYGFSSKALAASIHGRIAPKLDQHIACERNRHGQLLCAREGAAVDFLVEDEDMRDVARWIWQHCPFDRMYYYGQNRPIHVSVGPANSREAYEMVPKGTRLLPRKLDF